MGRDKSPKKLSPKALELLDEISEHIGTCCAITMEPDEVLDLLNQLREEINKLHWTT